MRSLLHLLSIFCLFAASPLCAGAWLREQGTTFTAVSFKSSWYRDTVQTTFVEYGLSNETTIGVDIAMGLDHFGMQSGNGTVFLLRALHWGAKSDVWSYEIGIGAAWTDTALVPQVKTGISWGRGIALRQRSGWLALDSSVAWQNGDGKHVAKMDGTLGLNFTERMSGMVQIFLSRDTGGNSGILAPSIIYRPGDANLRVQLGIEAPIDRTDDTAIKLGLWREF